MKHIQLTQLACVAFCLTSATIAWAFDFNAASERALEEVPGGVVSSVERDFEFGRPVIEVEVDAPNGDEHELVFDAAVGTLLAHRIDD